MDSWIKRYTTLVLLNYNIIKDGENYVVSNKELYVTLHESYYNNLYNIIYDLDNMLHKSSPRIIKTNNNTLSVLKNSLIEHFKTCVKSIKQKYNIDTKSYFMIKGCVI